MGVLLKNAGLGVSTNYLIHPRKALLTTGGDTQIAIVFDPNDSTAPGGYGDASNASKIYVYQSTTTAHTAWTLQATLTPTNGLDKDATYDAIYACGISSAGAPFVVYRATGGALRMLTLDSSTFAIATDVQIAAQPASGKWIAVDVSVLDLPSSADAVLVAAQYSKPGVASDRIGHSVYLRRGSDSTFVNLYTRIDNTAADIEQANAFGMIAVTWVQPDPAANVASFVVATSTVSTASDGGWALRARSVDADSGGSLSTEVTVATGDASYIASASSTYTDPKRRVLDLFCDGLDSFVFAGAHRKNDDQGAIWVTKFTITDASPPVASQVGTVVTTLSAGTMNIPFYFSFGHRQKYASGVQSLQTVVVAHYYAKLTGVTSGGASYPYYVLKDRIYRCDGSSVTSAGLNNFDLEGDDTNITAITGKNATPGIDFVCFPHHYVGSGNINWLNHHSHEGLYIRYTKNLTTSAVTGREWRMIPILTNSKAPSGLQPTAGSTVNTSEPSLYAALSTVGEPQSRYKGRFQVDVSTGFNVVMRDVEESDGDFAYWNPAIENVPSAQDLEQGNWYMRARYVDELGNEGPWTTLASTFNVSHPPSAVQVFPSGGITIQYGSGQVTFDWNFSDTYANDSQTAFQVIVEKVSDGSTILDSTKVTSSTSAWTGTIPAIQKDVPLRWKVRVWDEDDVVGSYSDTQQFTVADPPTLTIGTPPTSPAVASPYVTAAFTPVVGGSRTITKYRVIVKQGADTLHDSGEITQTGTASGVQINYAPGVSVYENNSNYTMTVQIWDNTGLTATANRSFSTAWTPPAAPINVAVSSAFFNVEGDGYLSLTWDNPASPDPDYVNWVIYRKLDEVDALGNVLEEGTWAVIGTDFSQTTSHEFRDYYAPASKKVNYRVRQVVNRFGDLIESANVDSVSIVPPADGYWLIEPTGADAYRLSIVTSDSYSDEYEEAEYNIIGRGRYNDRGDHLGLRGQLNAQLRDTGGTTARQKKRRLEDLKLENRDLYLRTPFGDVYRVAVGNLGVGRIAGVSTNEFVDVTLPYTQVAE